MGLPRARTGPLVLARSSPRAFLKCGPSAFQKRHRGPFGGDLWAAGRGSRSAPDFSPIWGIFINFERKLSIFKGFRRFPYQNATKPVVGLRGLVKIFRAGKNLSRQKKSREKNFRVKKSRRVARRRAERSGAPEAPRIARRGGARRGAIF